MWESCQERGSTWGCGGGVGDGDGRQLSSGQQHTVDDVHHGVAHLDVGGDDSGVVSVSYEGDVGGLGYCEVVAFAKFSGQHLPVGQVGSERYSWNDVVQQNARSTVASTAESINTQISEQDNKQSRTIEKL